MYTSCANVLEILALLKAHGIQDAVLCPGSRNIPLNAGFALIREIKCHCAVDERSAGFMALGMCAALRRPVAVVVTSGSALLNLHPAVAEAHYRELPLLVIAADRPAAWIGQMDGQTLPQEQVFHGLVKFAGTAAEISRPLDQWHCSRVINEALLKLAAAPCGPVLLNVPISDPFFDFSTAALPDVRTISRLTSADLPDYLAQFKRPLMVIGQYEGPTPDKALLDALTQRFTVSAEPLSNCPHPQILQSAEAVFAAAAAKQDPALAPDLVITLGGHILSKSLKKYVRALEQCAHLDICAGGEIRDVFCRQSAVMQAEFIPALQTLAGIEGTQPKLRDRLRLKSDLNQADLPWSALELIRRMVNSFKEPLSLHLGNSSTVRYASYYRMPDFIRVFGNRGVNGIEGSLSAAVGAALARPEELQLCLIGDLSFFYDLNALWSHGQLKNLRVVLFNNHGGSIFKSLPGLELPAPAAPFVIAPHQAAALPWAQSCGFACVKITNLNEFEAAWPDFMQPSSCAELMEIITDSTADMAALTRLKQEFKI